MKTIHLSTLLFATVSAFDFAYSATPGGEDPFRKTPRASVPAEAAPAEAKDPTVKLVFETYTMEPQLARDVLVGTEPQLVYGRILELVKNNQARLDRTATMVASNGQHVLMEETKEFRYPTEWEPALLLRPKTPADPVPPGIEVVGGPDGFHWTEAPAAASFDTRNLGFTVEVDPVLRGDGCDLAVAVASVKHLGDREMAPGTKVAEPLFETRSAKLHTVVPFERTTFLATLNSPLETGVPEATGRAQATLCFVTVSPADATAAPISPFGDTPAATFVGVVELYSMPQVEALRTAKRAGGQALAGTLGLVSEGKARLEDVVAIRGVSGRKQTVGSMIEYSYATEWDPAKILPTEAKRWPEIPALFSWPTPTSWETRNLGLNVEILVAPAARAWQSEVAVKTTRLAEVRETPVGSHMYSPEFASRSLTSQVVSSAQPGATRGHPVLIGTLTAPADSERSWVAFLTMHEQPTTADSGWSRASRIVIPEYSVREMRVDQAITRLEALSRESDSDGMGVRIQLRDAEKTESLPRVSVALANAHVADVIKHLANLAELQYAERNGVIELRPILRGSAPSPAGQ